MWATFVRKFVTKNVQKSPILVTLHMSKLALIYQRGIQFFCKKYVHDDHSIRLGYVRISKMKAVRFHVDGVAEYVSEHIFKFLNGPFLAFSLIFVFSIQLKVNKCSKYKSLLLAGFEPRTSGVKSVRSTN